MASPQSFSAQIDAWTAKTRRRADAVLKSSVQDVFRDAQTPVASGGSLPVDTGFLRASLTLAIGGGLPPGIGPRPPDLRSGETYSGASPTAYQLVVARMKVGDVLTGTWSAAYARAIEYGVGGRAGRRFVAQAAEKWERIVDASAAYARRRFP